MQAATALFLALLAAFAPAVPLRACSCPAEAREPGACCCCSVQEEAGQGCCCGERKAPREKVCDCSHDPAPRQVGPAGFELEAPQPNGSVTASPGPAIAPAFAGTLPDAAEPPNRATPLLL